MTVAQKYKGILGVETYIKLSLYIYEYSGYMMTKFLYNNWDIARSPIYDSSSSISSILPSLKSVIQ